MTEQLAFVAARQARIDARTEAVFRMIEAAANAGATTPSLRGIADAVGMKSDNSAHDHIDRLVAEGRLKRKHLGAGNGRDLVYIVVETGRATTLPPVSERTRKLREAGGARDAMLPPDDPKPESLLREEAIAALYAGRRYEDDPLACLPMRKLTMPRPEPGYVPTRSSAEWGAW